MKVMLRTTNVFFIGIVILSTMLMVVILPDKASLARRYVDLSTTNDYGLRSSSRQNRPIMHTFFETDDGNPDGSQLLEVWRDEWEMAGFETRVLNMKDAKKHPLYQEMKDTIGPTFGETYNGLCFYRWLAMANQKEGGWMSDFDTFPTHFFREGERYLDLPNGGSFTSFDNHTPSLLSGTSEEWNRVAKLLIQYFPETDGFKSDMMVWMHVRDSQPDHHNINFIESPRNMAKGFLYESPRKVNCKAMNQIRAVHVSHRKTHDAYVSGNFPLENFTGRPEDNRAGAVKILMDDWRDQCTRSISTA